MPLLDAAVWTFLKERFAGKENAAPRVTILSRFNLLRISPVSDRDFRETVSQLVIVYKKPICTTPAVGYFVAKTEAEKREALNYLDSVLTEVGDRRRALGKPIRQKGRRGCFDGRLMI
jgi:replication-associated recombination protein RarA